MLCAGLLVRKGFKFWEIKKTRLLLLAFFGIALYGLLALEFGVYGNVLNDVPALFGYTALALLIYRLGIGAINRFILFTERISYPLFLVHLLILKLVLFFSLRAGIHFNWPLLGLTLIL